MTQEKVDYIKDQMILDMEDYMMYRCSCKGSNDRYLIREYKDHVSEERIYNEIRMFERLMKCKNENVIKFISHCTQDGVHFSIFEDCLFNLEVYSTIKDFTDGEIMDISFALFKVIRWMNNQSIYLVNLRPNNIWISLDESRRMVFKVTDFPCWSGIESSGA